MCKSRTNLQHHKQPFAHDVEPVDDLVTAIRTLKPTALVGVSTIAKAFNKEVVEAMCALNERPIVFPLSNPTSKSECTYEEAYRCAWLARQGRAAGRPGCCRAQCVRALQQQPAVAALQQRPHLPAARRPPCTPRALPRSWSGGKVLFASGSPFDPIADASGTLHYPAQANNAYIFPAVGYAAVLARSSAITDEMFVLAAEELSTMTDMEELEVGR